MQLLCWNALDAERRFAPLCARPPVDGCAQLRAPDISILLFRAKLGEVLQAADWNFVTRWLRDGRLLSLVCKGDWRTLVVLGVMHPQRSHLRRKGLNARKDVALVSWQQQGNDSHITCYSANRHSMATKLCVNLLQTITGFISEPHVICLFCTSTTWSRPFFIIQLPFPKRSHHSQIQLLSVPPFRSRMTKSANFNVFF